jgi:excisionase family DNA binding protein
VKPRLLHLTLQEAAKAAGVAVSTVHRWCDVEGLPSKRDGRARLIRADALIRFLAHRDVGPGSQRERLAKEQADRAALDNAERRGEFVLVDHVRYLSLEADRHLCAEMDGAAGRMASELVAITSPAEMRAKLIAAFHDIRRAYADRLGKIVPPPGVIQEKD